MKKILLSMVALTSIAMAAQAQITIIPKVGVTLSNVALKVEADGQKSKTGLVMGAGVNFALDGDGFFSLQPEILYTQKGYRAETFKNDDSKKNTYTLNYLEIPVLAKISFGNETIKGYVNAGPSLGFGMGGKYTKTDLSGGTTKTEVRNIQFDTKPENYSGNDKFIDNGIDFGLQFGGGVGVKLGPGSMIFDLRYGLGMSDLSPKQPTSDFNNSKNRLMAISVGYAIPLGGK